MKDHVNRPNFTELQKQIRKSFTASANFLPSLLTYWCCPPELTRFTQKSASYSSHPKVALAVANKADTCTRDALPLLLAHTRKGAPGISVCDEEWDADSIFEVHYYQADSYNEELCFTRCASLRCRVLWGKRLTCNPIGRFQQNSTRIEKSDCLQAAAKFIQLLTVEFGMLS